LKETKRKEIIKTRALKLLGFWKIPENFGHLGKVGGGCKKEPRSL